MQTRSYPHSLIVTSPMKPSVICWDRARDAKRKFIEEFKIIDWLVGIGLNPMHPDGYFLDAHVLKIKEDLPDVYDGVPVKQTVVPSLASCLPDHWKGAPSLKWEKIVQKQEDGTDFIAYKGPWGSIISDSFYLGSYSVSCHALGFTSLPMFGAGGGGDGWAHGAIYPRRNSLCGSRSYHS